VRPLAVVMLSALVLSTPARADGDLYALAINGGGDRMDNFASHLAHLRQLVDLLSAAGVPRDRIIVLASDGGNPAPDLATRAPEPAYTWLLQGTSVDPELRDLTTYESSTLAGVPLRPATRTELSRAIGELRRRLHPGDTLLIYVTDHGTESRWDPIDNRITLWGAHEAVSARSLGSQLSRLPSTVRVVSLMSQCYSGGFAYLYEARERSRVPGGSTCGFFSSTPDRPAYGCYPEVRGQKAVGHSFEFLSALARRHRFPAAHRDVLWSDDTPDIPLRSSDLYLAELLARRFPGREKDVSAIDTLLRKALAEPDFATERRLLDRIAGFYDVPHPVSLGKLDEDVDRLFDFLDELDVDAKVWETALVDHNRAGLDGLIARQPLWRERLSDKALRHMKAAARRARATELLAALVPYLSAEPSRLDRAERLFSGLVDTDEIAYRTEVRVAALLRMRFVLTSLVGREWIKQRPAQGKAFAALLACEDLALPLPVAENQSLSKPASAKLPPLAEDQRRALQIRPGWVGITYVPLGRGRRARLSLPAGAVAVTSVVPRSPAAEAGLRRGDIVVGASNHAFTYANDLRPVIVAAALHAPLPLDVVRGRSRIVVSPVVREAPRPRRRNLGGGPN